MTHNMQLQPISFEMIKNGTKTIELRLCDEKRRKIQIGDEADLEHVKEELADVIVYCQDMLDCLDLDVDEIVNSKMTKNEAKYPVEKSRGSAAKYTDF